MTHCYIAVTRDGRTYGMVVDDPEYPEDTALSVADFIREGLTIERVTWTEMRERMTEKNVAVNANPENRRREDSVALPPPKAER